MNIPTFTLRLCKSKHWPILAESIPLGYGNVYATVAEAKQHLLARFGNVRIINITGKEN